MAYDQAHDVRLFGAQRQTYADLLAPLRDRVSQHSVDPNSGQNKRRRRKNSQQQHDEARLTARSVHEFVCRLNVGNGLVGVHGRDLRADRRDYTMRIHRRAHQKIHVAPR